MPAMIYGVITDARLAKMMEIYQACNELNMSYPPELQEYLGDCAGEEPETIRREKTFLDLKKAVREIADPDGDVYELDVKNIPDGIKAIRVEVYW